jgi:hypothetical protein
MPEKTKKVTVNLPDATFARAMSVTGRGITLTIIEALEELDRRGRSIDVAGRARQGSIQSGPRANPTVISG